MAYDLDVLSLFHNMPSSNVQKAFKFAKVAQAYKIGVSSGAYLDLGLKVAEYG